MMRLGELERYGLPKRLIERWAGRQGERLLPVQSRAVLKGLLGNGHGVNAGVSVAGHRGQSGVPGVRRGGGEERPVRMLISAPTAAGKSFCAEMAIARAIVQRRKAVMLLPLKALAEQKYRTLADTFGALGVKCLIASGDHPENDRAFAEGDYDVAVAIYEKFDMLLTANLDALQTIGLLVIDEIQTIAEPGRGAVLEQLLTRVLGSVYVPSLLGLSAVIGETDEAAGRLADWLGATLVEESRRPVDLRRGVAAEGSFRYRCFNSGDEDTEPFAADDPGLEPWENLVGKLREESGSTLVFLKSRRETVSAALRLATEVGWDPAKGAMEALADEEQSFLLRTLRQVLGRGVAFHNADLTSYQRQVVEQAFIDKQVKVVFTTTTLAMGVDLPADTVYLETVKYCSGVYDSKPSLVPVSRAEFDNMTGRAGRLGRSDGGCGRAVILAGSEFERDILWENYIAPGGGWFRCNRCSGAVRWRTGC